MLAAGTNPPANQVRWYRYDAAVLLLAGLFGAGVGLLAYQSVITAAWGWVVVAVVAAGLAVWCLACARRRHRHQEFAALTHHDPQTGLLNRAGFVARASRVAVDDCVVVRVDIDVLSTVSDALGYAWGDRVTTEVAARLRAGLDEHALIARLEGGRFAALLPARAAARTDTRCDTDDTARALHAGLSRPYPVDRLSVEATATVGYVRARRGGTSGTPGVADADILLQRADLALHAARTGDEPVREYAPSMGQLFLRRFQLVTSFRQALESGEIEVHYQPKIALPSREVLGAEALVRWRHPEFGRLDPDEFVPAVEASGLVDALTEFVTERSLDHVRKWARLGVRLSASVNLSVRNLADEAFPDRVADTLARHSLAPSSLTFELTESGVMADPERALPVLNRLHAMGVRLAVDDFGTGYSSLAYLRQLPVDEVKIDKSFVLGMATSLGDLAVVRATVELGHSLGLDVVAEGVEGDEVRDQLIEMGCDVAQGYLIARPLSPDRFAAWVQARTTPATRCADDAGQLTAVTFAH